MEISSSTRPHTVIIDPS